MMNGVHVQIEGAGDPVVLLAGLSGNGSGWGDQISRFADDYLTIVPDHPGVGGSAPVDDISIEQHATAIAGALRDVGCGPAHLVGSSTGGAIAMVMGLDHPDVVRSLSLVSSWARGDDFFRHQFAVRKDVLERLGLTAYIELSALCLFSPEFFRRSYAEVRAWADRPSEVERSIMAARIDMILAHDALDRLGKIRHPTLVLVGNRDGCTPPYLSTELAAAIPGAELKTLEGGHLIYKEDPERFHAIVTEFIGRH
jgi:aminoacrylate hydrolase